MAFTRSLLKSIGLSEEQVQAVIDAHMEVVNPLKQERDQFKEEAGKAASLKDELDALKSGEDYKAKYEAEHQALESYKAQVKAEAEQAKVKAAYRRMLTEENVRENHLDAVERLTDYTKMKLDKDGNLADADQLRQTIKSEWGEYIGTPEIKGANVATPPHTGKAARSKEEIIAIKNTAERQKAIAENHELFGF